MTTRKSIRIASASLASLALSAQAIAAQWVTSITATQVISGNSGGEYVQLLVASTIVNPAACATSDSYIIRDPAIVKNALAIGLTAIAAGRQIRVYVSDSCDAPTGRPLAISIGLM